MDWTAPQPWAPPQSMGQTIYAPAAPPSWPVEMAAPDDWVPRDPASSGRARTVLATASNTATEDVDRLRPQPSIEDPLTGQRIPSPRSTDTVTTI